MYKNGDYARTSKYKHIFEKRYENNWGDEFFKVVHVIRRNMYLVTQRKLFIYLSSNSNIFPRKWALQPTFMGVHSPIN
jgi:hypothetical protein